MYNITVEDQLRKLRVLIAQAKRPVAITGAGISVASGLPTANSSWHGIRIRDFFTFQMFTTQTETFFNMYRSLITHWHTARPNPAHYALAQGRFLIITQNIDGLHQAAGSRHVLAMHGNLLALKCVTCNARYTTNILLTANVPRCPACSGIIKPDIVLVGEQVHHYSTAVDWIGRSDLLLVVGTKLEMAPCRELPKIAARNGVPVFQMNKRAEKILPLLITQQEKIL